MSEVLQAIRAKYPDAYGKISDEDLALAIGQKYPVYLEQDASLRELYNRAQVKTLPTAKPGSELAGSANPFRITDELNRVAPGRFTSDIPTVEVGTEPAMGALIAKELDRRTGGEAQALQAAGKVLTAAVGDVANVMRGDAPENVAAFAQRPDAPLPVEEAVQGEPALSPAGLAGRVSQSVTRATPALGTMSAAGLAGVPAAASGAALMGLRPEGGVSLAGAAAGAALPAVDSWAREMTAKGLANLINDNTKLVVTKLASGELTGELVKRFPFLRPNVVQKALEVSAGQLAANAMLTASMTPEILASDDPAKTLQDVVIDNVGMSLMGAAEIARPGPSGTARQLAGKPVNVELRQEPRGRTERDVTPRPKASLSQGEEFVGPDTDAGVPAPEPPAPGGAPVQPEPAAQPAAEPARAQVPAGTVEGAVPPGGAGRNVAVATPAAAGAPAQPAVRPEWLPEVPPGVVLGRQTTVDGANKQEFPAVYAWASLDELQASHESGAFSVNPRYAPLTNTRDYSKDMVEREKVLDGARSFRPSTYATNVRGAGEGPVMVSPDINDGTLRVLGGNGRTQMLKLLDASRLEELGRIMDEEAVVFGLPPRPSSRHVVVRLLPRRIWQRRKVLHLLVELSIFLTRRPGLLSGSTPRR